MNILHVISGGEEGGSKTHILNLCRNLKNKNVNATIVCFIDGSLYREAKNMEIDIVLIKQKSRLDFSVIKRIKKIIIENNIELVHSHGGRANLICYLIKRNIKIPFISTVHSDYKLDYKGNVFKTIVFSNINKHALKHFDMLIAISDDFKEMLVRRGFDPSSIHVVYNGVDFDREGSILNIDEISKKYNIPITNKDVIISIVARLHPIKGHKVFFDGCKNIIQKHDNIKILVAGDGNIKDELMSYVKEIGIDKNVFFLGQVTRSIDIFYNSYMSVLSSFSESFPYVLLESALVKTPVIASDVGGINKIIKSGITGYLFNKGDSNDLSNKMEILLKNRKTRDDIGNNLYEYAKENFSLDIMTMKIIDIYKEIINS